MNLNEGFGRIMALTGKGEGDLLTLAWETGCAWVESMEEGRPEIKAATVRDKSFWNWYNKQFGELTKEYLMRRADGYWRRLGKDQIWAEYKGFVSDQQLTDIGQKSYAYVMSEVIEPGFRKKEKINGIVSPKN